MASTLDHIEKTLADAYRKEIDQEDNVWRTLPFFAATISFEMAALSQVLGRIRGLESGTWWDAIAAVTVIALSIVFALFFLAWSIAPAKFIYVSDEPALLAYARGLDRDERDAVVIDALAMLRSTLADQYAVATHHNRQINQRRAFLRSVAGLATLASVLFTMFLVIRLLLHYMPNGV